MPNTQQIDIPVKEEVQPNLVAKIAAACDAVGGVEKKGRNQAQGYDYVKAADVAKSIRHELFSRGVILLQDEAEIEWHEFQTMKGSTMRECRLKIAYHLTDGIEEKVMHAFGVAMDSGDKAIYKAKTGALKYFLRGLGLIPDEKDDPEGDESVDRNPIQGRMNKPDTIEDQSLDGAVAEQCEWIANAKDLAELQSLYKSAYKKYEGFPAVQRAIVLAKDKKKQEFQ